ncbi:lipoprotein signal peptidase [Alloscardovia macacae]|uniref:Lipoprotein signal peptidase n=1 Tax=Alloscardovia macacae TaxID=1160091 RepID=A0A1Y2SZ52_9BIFI|nr:lipoprotein signal peptidase [Alloscardovia macacae]OTA28047.1 lipoprotein signal peptidase [Alloscardovia macacae]
MVCTSERRSHVPVAVFCSTVIVGLVLDQWTKSWALAHLSAGQDIPVLSLGPLRISLMLLHNPGASLGFGSSVTWIISLFALAAACAIGFFALRTTSVWWALALGLTVSGAVGNLIDRVLYAQGFLNGRVVDFINYGPFVGNVADIILGFAAVSIIGCMLLGVKTGIARMDSLLFDSANSSSTTSAGEARD